MGWRLPRAAASRLHRITAWRAAALPWAIVMPPLAGLRRPHERRTTQRILSSLGEPSASGKTVLAPLKQTFQQDPAAFLRLVQALPRLSQGGMNCEHVRLKVAERKVQLEKDKAPEDRAISPETLRLIHERFGLG